MIGTTRTKTTDATSPYPNRHSCTRRLWPPASSCASLSQPQSVLLCLSTSNSSVRRFFSYYPSSELNSPTHSTPLDYQLCLRSRRSYVLPCLPLSHHILSSTSDLQGHGERPDELPAAVQVTRLVPLVFRAPSRRRPRTAHHSRLCHLRLACTPPRWAPWC